MIDYCILEAVIMRVKKEDDDAEKAVQKTNWKRDKEALARLKTGAPVPAPDPQSLGLELEKF